MNYAVKWVGKAFGERLNTSLFVHLLRDYGVEAVFANNHIYYKELVDCPFYDEEVHADYKLLRLRSRGGADRITSKSILHFLRDKFYDETGVFIDLKTNRDHIPVKYYDIPSIDSFDVTLCTKSGKWTPYRNWPYFNELKNILDKNDISYFDLSRVKGIELLNYVNKSKLYVGLETGTSHYVSQVANGKALIIQSGYTNFKFWATLYNYKPIQVNIDCRPCFLREGCKNNHKCMREISADIVAKEIMGKL